MSLAKFIRGNTAPIIAEWENFAQTLIPQSANPTPLNLRDHIKEILAFIASDIETAQSKEQQVEKSHGEKPEGPTPTAAEVHASLRHAGGVNLNQMVSEFRALRASVVKLWDASLKGATHADLTDLTRFNEAIDQALTEAIQDYSGKMDISRDLFLEILDQDLRQPLDAISTSAELTTKIGPLSERQAMLQSQIADSSARAEDIVSQLLDITKTRLGSGLPIIKAPMDLGLVSTNLVDEIRTLHPERTIDMQVEGDTEGNWDKARIGQVFSNLLGNALQYGFKSTPINVKIKGNADEIVVSVNNEGVPIAQDVIATIFDSLSRPDPSSLVDGEATAVSLGLGLFITKEIITAHGGMIGVVSSEKNGTTFTATLPR